MLGTNACGSINDQLVFPTHVPCDRERPCSQKHTPHRVATAPMTVVQWHKQAAGTAAHMPQMDGPSGLTCQVKHLSSPVLTCPHLSSPVRSNTSMGLLGAGAGAGSWGWRAACTGERAGRLAPHERI